MADALGGIGADVKEYEDRLVITGKERVHGGGVKGENDHRVLMALAAASLKSDHDITVTDAHSINKSYPNFYRDFISLGGKADVINMG